MWSWITLTVLAVRFIQGSTAVTFINATREAILPAGSPMLLQCETTTSVLNCRWLWLSPHNDYANLPVVVSSFTPSDADRRICSVDLKSLTADHEGVWICSVKETEDAEYVMASPFKLTVVEREVTTVISTTKLVPREVQFAEITPDHAVKLGMPMHLICKTAETVNECLWTWQPNSTAKAVAVKKVEPFGDQRLHCDFRIDHVLPGHNGIWTCGARFERDQNYSTARPIHVTIMKEVGFVQLTQDIQVTFDQPTLLRCVTNIAVEQCQWVRQAFNKNNETMNMIKPFPPYGEDGRDCSVRLSHVFEEHAGDWTCQARQDSDDDFSSAPSAKLTILYPVTASFMEEPRDTDVEAGQPVVLRCVTSSPMEECSWTWRPINDNKTAPMLVKSFPPFDNYSRDCSVRFKSILREQEGVWGCQVRGTPTNTTLISRLTMLTVYDKGPVSFERLTSNVNIFAGGTMILQCVTARKVDLCRWTLQPPNAIEQVLVRQFPPTDAGGRDCTLKQTNVQSEQEGVWTCGAMKRNDLNSTVATPTSVTVMHPESVTVALWSSPESSVSIACCLNSPQVLATCNWYHPPRVNISELNHTKRYSVHHKKDSGVCTLTFAPGPQDLGQWTCGFNVDTQAGLWEMASANLILLTTTTPGFTVSEDKMGWLIGLLAVMVLILTATLVAVSLCKCRNHATEDKTSLGNAVSQEQGDKKGHTRYTDTPTKINFQFGDTTIKSTVVHDADVVLAPDDASTQHIYERVDRCITPVASKSIYENVQ